MISEACEYARWYASLGLKPIPLKFRDKRPLTRWKELSVEKALEIICREPVNVGIVTGYGGLVVLDFDDKEEAIRFIQKHPLPLDWVVETHRGVHIYLRVDCLSADLSTRRFGKVDLKGEGGYVVAPPSIHPSGKQYTFKGGKPERLPEINCEEWQRLLEALEEMYRPAGDAARPVAAVTRGGGSSSGGGVNSGGGVGGGCFHLTSVDKIVDLLRPYYVPGHRNNIVFSLLGMLVKRGVCPEDSRKVVEKLALSTGDEEIKHRLYLVDYHYTRRIGLELKGASGLREEIARVLTERGVPPEEADAEASRVVAQLAYLLGIRRGSKAMWLKVVNGRVVAWVVLGRSGIYLARETSDGRVYELLSPAVIKSVRLLRSDLLGDMWAVQFEDGREVVGSIEEVVSFIKRYYGIRPAASHIIGRLVINSATEEEELVYAPGVWFDGNRLKFHRKANYNPPWRSLSEIDIPIPPKEPSRAARDALRRFVESYRAPEKALLVLAYGVAASFAHYFRQRYGYWPHMIVYGRRDTGKSTLLEMVELLYGAPLRERVPVTEFRARKLLAETTLPALIEEANELLAASSHYAGALEVLHAGVTVTKLATVHHPIYGGVFLSIRSAILTSNFGVELPEHMRDKFLVVEIDQDSRLEPDAADGYTPRTMKPELMNELRGTAYYFVSKLAQNIANYGGTLSREKLVASVLARTVSLLAGELGLEFKVSEPGAELLPGLSIGQLMAYGLETGLSEDDVCDLFEGWVAQKLEQIGVEHGRYIFTIEDLKLNPQLVGKIRYGYPAIIQLDDEELLVIHGNGLRWFKHEMERRGVKIPMSVGMLAKVLGLKRRRIAQVLPTVYVQPFSDV